MCTILILVRNQLHSYIMHSSDGFDYLSCSQTINGRLEVRDENIPRVEHKTTQQEWQLGTKENNVKSRYLTKSLSFWIPSFGGVLYSVQFSPSVMSNSLWPHESQHARPPCPSPAARVYPNPCPNPWWCHLTISSNVVPFSSCPQSFPASGSFQMSQLFKLSGQSIGVSASTSVLPMNTQNWPPLGWTGWISLQSKGLSRVFSNTTVQKHQFFGTQLSLQSNSHIHTWPLEKP